MEQILKIDISKMNFGETFLEKMQPMVEKAINKMKDLESGAIANPDEKWMVGHYWLRNPELAPNSTIKNEILTTIDKIKSFSQKILAENNFKNVVLIGIGGSALGNMFVLDALRQGNEKLNFFFLDNTDPDGISRTLKQIGDLTKTLGIVISKSGSTPEPRNSLVHFIKALKDASLEPNKHLIAITKNESQLFKTAKNENWLDIFPMWDWVGGRTSVWSAVGLLPMALSELNMDQFLKGARDIDILTRDSDIQKNPAMQLALMWYHAGCGKGLKSMVILPYRDRLLLFSRYLQQLIMESLGKEKDLDGNIVNQGISVYGNKGSTDQHAYVQQLRDGLNNFFVVFIRTLQGINQGIDNKIEKQQAIEVEPEITSEDYLHAFYLGTRKALADSKRESLTITTFDISEYSIGQLIAVFERAVGFYAIFINVNAYNQPGVEAGKKAAGEILELQKRILKSIKSNNIKYKKNEFSVENIFQELKDEFKLTDSSIILEILEPFIARGEV